MLETIISIILAPIALAAIGITILLGIGLVKAIKQELRKK